MAAKAKLLLKTFRYGAFWAPFNRVRIQFLKFSGIPIGKNVYVGRRVFIGRGIVIGDSCYLVSGSTLEENIQLGNRVHISAYSIISQAQIGDDVIIGDYARVSHAVIGKRSHIETGVIFTGFRDGFIHIEEDTYIGIGAILDWSGNMKVGNSVHIAGPSTGIWTHSSVIHALVGGRLQCENHRTVGSVVIENNTWIGGNCTIYPGVKIGHNCVVLPNSVIDKDVQPYSMVGGVPIKLLRKVDIQDNIVSFQQPKHEKDV